MMQRSTIALIFFLLFPVLCFSQVILNKPQDIPTTDIVFNPSFIKENKIRSVKVDLSMKPDNKVIDDKGLMQLYEFDTLGRVSRFYYTIISGTTTREIDVPALYRRGRVVRKAYTRTETTYAYDTISTSFYYDSKSRLTIKRTNTGEVYNAVYYTYDIASNDIIKEVRCKESNTSEIKGEFRLGIQTVTSMETFEYEKTSPTQVKKKSLNDEGRVYRQTIINYDSKGNKLDESSEYVVTWMNAGSTWKYDEQGRLIEAAFATNATGDVRQESKYEYDAKGNLVAEKRYKNKEQTNEISYLYDESSKLLKSQVNRDFPQKQIGIVKYSYGYYK